MKKQILKLKEVKELSSAEKKSINGGGPTKGGCVPTIAFCHTDEECRGPEGQVGECICWNCYYQNQY